MNQLFTIIIVGLFCLLLFVNLFFRMRVLKLYKILVQNKIQFSASHIWNAKKMEDEVIAKHPRHEKDIRLFVQRMKQSLLVAIGIILAIAIVGILFQTLK